MSAPHPRDRAVDALLRRQLQKDGGGTDACLEPEILAAWVDNSLDAATLAQAEAHLADCAHCQAVLAAIVQSEPAPVAAVPWWSRLHMRWLVPLTAATAATVLWVAIGPGAPNRVPPPIVAESTIAQAERNDAATPEQEAPRPAAPTAPVLESIPAPAARPPAPGSPSGAPPSDPAGGRANLAQAGEERARADALADRQKLAKEVAPQGATVSDETRQQARAEEKGAPAPPPPPAVDAPPPAPLEEPVDAPATRASGRAIGASGFGAAATGTIVSRDPAVIWRLAGPGVVERSMDRGATWQRIETGMRGVFTSGFAPSRSVCWLIGPGGLVAVTGDGRTWRQLPSPGGAAELTAVDAENEREATVRDAAGRAFHTTDGGATWVPMP